MFRFPNISLPLAARFKDRKLSQFLRSAQSDQQGQIHIGPRQIYILPTRFGLMYATLVIAMLIGAINYANNLGYLLTFFLGAIGVITILHTWRNLLDLQLIIQPVSPVFAGQHFDINIQVVNLHKRSRGALQLAIKNSSSFTIKDIEADSEQVFNLPVKAESRGWLRIKQMVLSTQYPLGLFRAWVYINQPVEVLVYPKPADNWKVPRTAVYSLSAQGDKGIGADDFVAHRNYRLTDSPKQIDWKIFAREKGLMTKQFGGDRSERLWLSLELLPDTPLEIALNKLTRAVLDADADHFEYGLKLADQTIDISHGDKHRSSCLKALALFSLPDKNNG